VEHWAVLHGVTKIYEKKEAKLHVELVLAARLLPLSRQSRLYCAK